MRCPRRGCRRPGRCCRRTSPSCGHPSGDGRSAARCPRTASRSPPRIARSRPRGGGRPGRHHRYGRRTTPRGSASTSPSTRGAIPGARGRPAVSQLGSPSRGPFQRTKSRTSSFEYSSAATRSPTRSWSGSSRARRPYAGQLAIRKKTEPSSVRYAWPAARRRSRRDTIWGMCSVARGMTSGFVMRSVAASWRNRSIQRSARASMPIRSPAAPRMILSSTSVRFMTQVTCRPRQRR